jgi:hypothetical protein
MLTDRERRRRLVEQQVHRMRYGHRHRMTRAMFSGLVQAGVVDCARIDPCERQNLRVTAKLPRTRDTSAGRHGGDKGPGG